jgi:CdiI immunity protein
VTREVFPPPPFELLVKGYFHEDWDLEGPTAQAILRKFAEKEPRDDVIGARDAAAALLRATESERRRELDSLGLHYDPEFEGLTHTQWLELVFETLSTYLEHSR